MESQISDDNEEYGQQYLYIPEEIYDDDIIDF